MEKVIIVRINFHSLLGINTFSIYDCKVIWQVYIDDKTPLNIQNKTVYYDTPMPYFSIEYTNPWLDQCLHS